MKNKDSTLRIKRAREIKALRDYYYSLSMPAYKKIEFSLEENKKLHV